MQCDTTPIWAMLFFNYVYRMSLTVLIVAVATGTYLGGLELFLPKCMNRSQTRVNWPHPEWVLFFDRNWLWYFDELANKVRHTPKLLLTSTLVVPDNISASFDSRCPSSNEFVATGGGRQSNSP